MKRLISLCLCGLVLLSGLLSGCAARPEKTSDLMEGVKAKSLSGAPVETGGSNAAAPTDFAVRLFRKGFRGGENTMISPVSVLYALAMTANGAKGETLSQMEAVFGMDLSQLNAYLHAYKNALPTEELKIANSIWLRDKDGFSVKQDFLQTNADYYGADIYKAPFSEDTCRDINAWVTENTDGMIEEILDQIPPNAVMYLVNAMAFEAQWQETYEEYQIREGVFTTEGGEEQEVEMMHSQEYCYLEDDSATGFIKYYSGAKYAFVALLPEEGLNVEDYIAGLTGAELAALLAQPQETEVITAIPKFESDYNIELSEVLTAMGMQDAFDGKRADFSGLGSSDAGNISISRVLHKTYISIDEKGTKAAAATVVEATEAAVEMEEFKEVILDRPFVYLIMDCEANLPLFMGAFMDAA